MTQYSDDRICEAGSVWTSPAGVQSGSLHCAHEISGPDATHWSTPTTMHECHICCRCGKRRCTVSRKTFIPGHGKYNPTFHFTDPVLGEWL